jgi:hypothetical protein
MPTGQALFIPALAALLGLLPLAGAHGDGAHGPDGKTAMLDAPGRPIIDDGAAMAMDPESYFALAKYASAMYAHIGLTCLAWIVVLPIGMDIERSEV